MSSYGDDYFQDAIGRQKLNGSGSIGYLAVARHGVWMALHLEIQHVLKIACSGMLDIHGHGNVAWIFSYSSNIFKFRTLRNFSWYRFKTTPGPSPQAPQVGSESVGKNGKNYRKTIGKP